MDTPITRAEHEEFRKRLDDENHRQNKRIDLLEKSVQQFNNLTASVEKLAVNMENMLKNQEEQGERLRALEGRDGKKWRSATAYVFTTVAGMMINVELFMQYVTYFLIAIGVLAFLTAMIVQVVKELPWLQRLPTSVVALVVSMILCLLAVLIVCQYFRIVIVWYYVFASFIAAFVVYLVATGGWERIADIWERTKYNRK